MLSVPPLAGLEDTIRFFLPEVAKIVSAEEVYLKPEREGRIWGYKNGMVRVVNDKVSKKGIYVPLKTGGWLLLVDVKKEFYQSVLGHYCSQVIENARRYDEIKSKTFIDTLTGIPNRIALHQRLSEEIEHKGYFGVIFLDVNNFKKVNDTYGHLVGDDVLRKAVHKIKAIMRTYDYLARYGGDEFVVILPRTSKEDAIAVAERISQQVIVLESGFKLSFSWGLAMYPDDGGTPEEILEYADARMYEYKNMIKGAYANG